MPTPRGYRGGVFPLVTRVTAVFALTVSLAGCGWFGDGKTSVFDLDVGDCVVTPSAEDTAVEVTEVERVACSEPHQMEVFALQDYVSPGSDEAPADYPGEDAVTAFADAACAAPFADYVGVDYRDSTLFYTYVLPTARSWGNKDRTITCFATTTGATLDQSVAGTKW